MTVRLLFVGFLIVVSLVIPAIARAQDVEAAGRRELLTQARAASDAGRHAEALDLAQRAASISMTVSLRAFISYEQEQSGQLAEALGTAIECQRDLNGNPTVENRAAIMQACTAAITRLGPRVGHVVVHVPSPQPTGFRVLVQGRQVPSALLDAPYVVTPGPVQVEATAPDHETFQQSITVAAGGSQNVTVQLVAQAPRPTPTPADHPTPPVVVHRSRVNGAALLVALVGVLGLGAGVGASLVFSNDAGTLNSNCSSDQFDAWRCNQSWQGAYNEYRTAGYVADVAYGVGGVVLAVGVAWFIVGLMHTTYSPREHVSIMLAPTGPTSLGVAGVF